MKYLLPLILASSPCWCRNDSRQAVKNLQRAILRNKEVKRIIKDTQNLLVNALSIDINDAKYLVPLAAIAAGKLDTQSIGGLRIKAYEGHFTPRVMYRFQGQSEIQTGIFFNKDF
jgi:hypothetical protein